MRKSISSIALVFVFLTLLLIGCATVSTPVPSTFTSLPPTAVTIPKITTSNGNVVITKAEIVSEDMFGNKAAPGYQILYVWFESADGSEIDGADFLDASDGVYVLGDDDSKTEVYSGGLLRGSLVLGFTPPVTAKQFTFYWGDNAPIELSLSQ